MRDYNCQLAPICESPLYVAYPYMQGSVTNHGPPCQFLAVICILYVQISIQRCLALTWKDRSEIITKRHASQDNSNALSPNKIELHVHSSSQLFYSIFMSIIATCQFLRIPILSKGSFVPHKFLSVYIQF